jgi:hypothetical protein
LQEDLEALAYFGGSRSQIESRASVMIEPLAQWPVGLTAGDTVVRLGVAASGVVCGCNNRWVFRLFRVAFVGGNGSGIKHKSDWLGRSFHELREEISQADGTESLVELSELLLDLVVPFAGAKSSCFQFLGRG